MFGIESNHGLPTAVYVRTLALRSRLQFLAQGLASDRLTVSLQSPTLWQYVAFC